MANSSISIAVLAIVGAFTSAAPAADVLFRETFDDAELV